MYARGLTARESESSVRAQWRTGHIEEIYGFKASLSLFPAITGTVMQEVTVWQNRSLGPCYPVVFMASIRVNIRSDGAVTNTAAFVALATCRTGHGTFWAYGSRPMRGARCRAVCATAGFRTS
ncbi:transposase [Leisingera methylohalidivorans]|uniref:Mutator family transposase n=1 Tax=Leisingera methylohalidivorans DSM 14336 TaxID=999552 RepID=V9W023_9RHOB|nr:transposase [Leisingera methylohalidivorans]AHD02985.1 hypothetical protein METH_07735 [Leisingera methylohalidivorans DSM 14336]